jgi:hypothetical protein
MIVLSANAVTKVDHGLETAVKPTFSAALKVNTNLALFFF